MIQIVDNFSSYNYKETKYIEFDNRVTYKKKKRILLGIG